MQLTTEQRRILEDIHAMREVSAEDATWAVKAGLAVQAEDGDIDLSQEGRQQIEPIVG